MLTDEDLYKIRLLVREEVRSEVKKELKPVWLEIRKIRRGIDIIIKFFDNEYLLLSAKIKNLN